MSYNTHLNCGWMVHAPDCPDYGKRRAFKAAHDQRILELESALRDLVQACTGPIFPDEPIYGVRMPEKDVVERARRALNSTTKGDE